ncbi:hypothetical protein [Subtercola sp. Z020]|uniref:hypothetical protein n=1 Tax=Subtercola sp. Z020 TaxID=2080582 RepID=UPI0011B02A44|nr:hypothetical protein [Subtercola sp. Z020]
MKFRETHNIGGYGWVIELTYSEEVGWHPHLHLYFFSGNDFDKVSALPVSNALAERWIASAASAGIEAASTGQNVRLIDPATSRQSTRYVMKDSPRFTSNQSGFHCAGDLLAAARAGEVEAVELWDEFQRATRGQRRYQFSNSLEDKLRSAQ